MKLWGEIFIILVSLYTSQNQCVLLFDMKYLQYYLFNTNQ